MVQKAYGTSQKWGACPKNTTGMQKAQKQKYENTNENLHLPSLFSYSKKKKSNKKIFSKATQHSDQLNNNFKKESSRD